MSALHPALANWFRRRFDQATPIQMAAWPRIAAGEHCLVSAGTGQGKTLAALLPLLSRMIDHGPGAASILYLSPLRALAGNLEAGLSALLEDVIWPHGPLRIAVRSGDTDPAERRRQLLHPPQLLLTTPESLFILLGSERGRRLLARVGSVIVDELHVYLGSKRGAHLALSLERLRRLRGRAGLQRLGLSATIRPMRLGARFLVGEQRRCALVRCPTRPEIELIIERGDRPLQPQPDPARWSSVLDRLADIVSSAARSLVFCNTRAQVERVAVRLGERLGAARVAAHHGSLGSAQRARIEAALRSGEVSAVVCSASLELGLDIGPLDQVCQLGAVNGIQLVLQRAGRSGHGPGRRPCLHLFPLSQADLLDAIALQQALKRNSIERGRMPPPADDVLAQQLVAILGEGPEHESAILQLIRRSGPWAGYSAARLAKLVRCLHDGFVDGREVGRGPLLRLGGGRLQATERAMLLSRLNAGTLPEWFDYSLIDADSGQELGRLDEEFAFESGVGQCVHLGGESFRIVAKGVQRLSVRRDPNAPAEMPFWLGEGSGRSAMLSAFLRRCLSRPQCFADQSDAEIRAVLASAEDQLGRLPGSRCIVIERFFDPGGDEHVVLHSLFGQRVNRAWGLALRKRFCRRFNFELQAAVTDNAVLISLGATHSFALEDVVAYLSATSLRQVLVQAVLDTPQFALRLRWCANIALAVARREPAGAVLPQIQRNQTENLIARVFPDQLACLENLSGPRQVPDHPLVQQALSDCLEDFMDTCGLERLYRAIERGHVAIHCVDTSAPSILAQAAIQAPRNAYLDPAAAEERRTRSFESKSGASLAALAAERQTDLLHPLGQSDGLERALLTWLYLPAEEGARRQAQWAFAALRKAAVAVALWPETRRCIWVHLDQLAVWLSVLPQARVEPRLASALLPEIRLDPAEALCRIALGAIRRCGAVTANQLATETGLGTTGFSEALIRLQQEGLVCARKEPGVFSERRERSRSQTVPAAAV
ncbi:MAG: DEAD/DEAH box helicase [Wenzhouxiangella sp.]